MSNQNSTRLRQLLANFDACDHPGDIIKDSIEFLRELTDNRDIVLTLHSKLCSSMVKRIVGGSKEASELLHLYGPAQTLKVVYTTVSHSVSSVAKWLSNEVLQIITSNGLTTILVNESKEFASARLHPAQEHLVGVMCRLPDVLSNTLSHYLNPSLLPGAYFMQVGKSLCECLQQVHSALRASKDCSLLLLAALLSKASLLGHKDSVLSKLVPFLEQRTVDDPLWRRLAQSLFSRVSTVALESVLEGLIAHVSPSLTSSCSLRSLIGEMVLTNQKAKFVLTHKLLLIRVPQSPHALHTLVGYLSSSKEGQELLGESLQSVLGVWSDSSAVRHMDSRQHMWISRVIVLGVTCLKEKETLHNKSTLQQLTMTGIQAHIESPLEQLRHIGMAVGECVMNKFNLSDDKYKLKFEYNTNEDIESIKALSRPMAVQEKELKQLRADKIPPHPVHLPSIEDKSVVEQHRVLSNKPERFGEGMVNATECSETDSDDDDLVPYSMDDDPDSSLPQPPRYLRTLIQALLSDKEPQRMEAALRVAESLIRSAPSDLPEVCVELTKILLHMSDSYFLDDFLLHRHQAMVALAVSCPDQVAPYLTSEFYSPNYNLRQRIDILEVLSTAAVELSQPQKSTALSEEPTKTKRSVEPTKKQWQVVIEERLKTKTRLLSKGHKKSSQKQATPNRFAKVAPMFFFPLMSHFDSPLNTLDLLGQDSLVLGNLLYTLGVIMSAAVNAPIASAMGLALLDFLWAIRYHPAAYVRQGVLFAMSMLIGATPPHILLEEMEGPLGEAVQWLTELRLNDADEQCRTLAVHTLGMFNAILKATDGTT